ncbi:hypothetical protein ACLOJK_009506 [Asimina triloba]
MFVVLYLAQDVEGVAAQPKSYILLDPFGGAVNRIASDAIAFPHRDSLYAIEYFVDWNRGDDVNRDEYMSWGPRAVYVNNVDLDLGIVDWRKPGLSGPQAVKLARAWGDKYFLGNYNRLVKAKTKIDPFNVFNNPQSIPPLVSLVTSDGIEEGMIDVI